jgi:UDP-GlcNAc:undecaprenyl-phosphate GlcNAc-1-phosphate transferase
LRHRILHPPQAAEMNLSPLVLSLVVCLLLMPMTIAFLTRMTVLDIPTKRSSHTRPTVRGAGLALMISTVGVFVLYSDSSVDSWCLVTISVGFGLLGFVDDLNSLSAPLRLAVQIMLGVSTIFIGLNSNLFDVGFLMGVVVSLALVAYVNCFNFMDGINGISGLVSSISGIMIAIAGFRFDEGLLAFGGLALAGASVGFLPYNMCRPHAFLGDVGSYFIGAWIALLSIAAIRSGPGPIFPLCLTSVYLIDVGWALAKRLYRNETLTEAHRDHAYQRLVDQGLPHLAVALIVSCLTTVSGLLGLFASEWSALGRLNAGAISLSIGVVYASSPRFINRLNSRI